MPAYLKYGTIKGEVTAEGHKEWIELGSVQYGNGRGISSPTGTSASRETGTVSVSEVVCTKMMDTASQELFNESITGTGKQAILHLCQTNATGALQTYLELTLEECLVSSYSMSSGGDKPSESLSLNFTKITYKYIPYDANNKPLSPKTSGYDLKTTKAF